MSKLNFIMAMNIKDFISTLYVCLVYFIKQYVTQ